MVQTSKSTMQHCGDLCGCHCASIIRIENHLAVIFNLEGMGM
uniref:Uncharacterized protein n=1 Tax=Anguilla anguilla TaxID=7936 RepID=A0A0E9VT55_ANGAN